MTPTTPSPASVPPPAWNPWPTALVAYFIVFIGCLIAYTTWAVRQNVDLVRADYYEQEIRYQQQIDRLGRTREFARDVAATYDAAQSVINISLPPFHATDATGIIHLYRPADSRLDRELKLALDPQGRQRVDARALAPGLWKARVQWNVNGQEYFFDRTLIIGSGLF